jgi:hypothetical protein
MKRGRKKTNVKLVMKKVRRVMKRGRKTNVKLVMK